MTGADLDVDIRLRLGTLDLDVAFTAADGEVLALLGPNGAGKSTVLRCLAGLQPIDAGHITLAGTVLDEPASDRFVPARGRPIGVVFQDHLLFPHLSALDNVAFGLRARGMARAEADGAARAWLARVDLADHESARPAALSGGQSQRVALARAAATEPRLLLLDEPLAALDASIRSRVRAELRHHLATFPGIRVLITHDPVDALVLADRIVIVEAGRVTQIGTTAEVVSRPRSRYAAELVGINLLPAVADRRDPRLVRLTTGATLAVADPAPAGPIAVAIRPQAIALHPSRPEGSPRNAWAATVLDLQLERDRVRVRLSGGLDVVAEVTPAAVRELALEAGTSVWASVKAVDLTTYEL